MCLTRGGGCRMQPTCAGFQPATQRGDAAGPPGIVLGDLGHPLCPTVLGQPTLWEKKGNDPHLLAPS